MTCHSTRRYRDVELPTQQPRPVAKEQPKPVETPTKTDGVKA